MLLSSSCLWKFEDILVIEVCFHQSIQQSPLWKDVKLCTDNKLFGEIFWTCNNFNLSIKYQQYVGVSDQSAFYKQTKLAILP